MGITGLLPFLDKASEKINIRSLANKTVAIDTYCWLHKGAFAVADKLARGEETDTHILYCLKYVNMLLSHNIKPILVFDGRHLPAKAETEAKRRENRKAAKQRAIELMKRGKHSEARNYLRRCVDITHEMALKLIQACREINVDSIVAPYEADGQLAYLNRSKIVDYVITEDSDLVLFGCTKILFKLDLTGACVLVDSEKLHLAMGCSLEKYSMDKFRYMCIISGCDYLDSLPGIGLAKACKFIMMTEETDMWRALDKIPSYLNMRQLTVTDEYKRNFLIANATFQHMVVYDPRLRKMVRLVDPEEVGTDLEYCCNAGEILDDDVALNLAVGNLNPFTLKALDDWHPDKCVRRKTRSTRNQQNSASHPSIWERSVIQSFEKKTKQATTFSVTRQRNMITTTTSVRRPISRLLTDDETEEENTEPQTEENSEDLLNQYTKVTQPPSKKFKDEIESDTDEEQVVNETEKLKITPTRNPFKKQQPVESPNFQSPTKITKENSSLINNHSPVKRIDFAKLEKLSKFKRTVITEKQNVISRFFNSKTSSSNESSESETTSLHENSDNANSFEKQSEINKISKIQEENVIASNCLYMNTSKDSDNESSESESVEVTTEYQRSTLNLQQTFGNKKAPKCLENTRGAVNNENITEDENTPNELISSDGSQSLTSASPIILTDDDDENDGNNNEERESVPNSNTKVLSSLNIKKSETQPKKKSACRRPGLSSKIKSSSNGKGGSTVQQQGAVQRKLSMFGFQRKPQAP